MSPALADRLQLWGVENDFIIFSDGSLGFGLDLTPLDISCWDDERVNSLAVQLRNFLNGLPIDIDVQFVQNIKSGNEDVIGSHARLAVSDRNAMAGTLSEERVRVLREFDQMGLLPRYHLSLLVRRPMAEFSHKKPKIFARERLFPQIAADWLRREMAEMTRLRDDVTRSLTAMSIRVIPIVEKDLMERVYRLWNPMRSFSLGSYNSDDVRSSLLFTDAVIHRKGFDLADMGHRIISLKTMPDQTMAGMAAALKDLPFDSELYLSIHVADQQKELASLQTQRRLAFSMVHGKPGGVRDIDSEAKLQDLETLLEEMVAQGERVFQVSLNILLRSHDENELDTQVSKVFIKIRELGGAEALEESVAAFDMFCQFSFPNARAKDRTRPMKTSNLADFIPLFGPWQGHEKPRVLLRSREGNLLKFDPFSSELTNANQLVSGGSGAGKSFLVNTLLLQMLKENPKVFIVDIGGSYMKLTETLDGQYIPLGVGSGLSLNPFDLKPSECKPDDQKIKFLVSLVEIMTKESSDEYLPRLERAELEQAIQEVYSISSKPRLSDLRANLLQHPDSKIQRIGRILGPWCGETPYGQFVDRETTVELSKGIICFDLKGMEAHPDLQAVSLFIITDLVWRVIQADRSTMKFTIFDESWKLLENNSGAQFIGEVFRTYRKYYASAIAISQTIDDFAKSKVANAILPNSAVKWILKQKGADKESLKGVLALNDNEVAAIDSLHQERGKYSEAFLMAGEQRLVVAVESTPLEYWICTTDPRDLAAIDDFKREHAGKTTLEVLGLLSDTFPHGVAANCT